MKNEDIGVYVFLAGLFLILVGFVWLFFYHYMHIEMFQTFNQWRVDFLKYWKVISPPGKLTLFGAYVLSCGIWIGVLEEQ